MLRLVRLIFFFSIAFISCSVATQKIEIEKYKELTIAKELSKVYNIPLDTTGNSEIAEIRKWTNDEFELSYSYESPNSNEYMPLIYYIVVGGIPLLMHLWSLKL